MQNESRSNQNRWQFWCVFAMCVTVTEERMGGVGGGIGVEIDKSSCDRNEECSVLKGLTSTPEVCFHSLIRQERSQCSSKQTNQCMFQATRYLITGNSMLVGMTLNELETKLASSFFIIIIISLQIGCVRNDQILSCCPRVKRFELQV